MPSLLFKVPPALGRAAAENIEAADFVAAVNLAGQLHQQIQSLRVMCLRVSEPVFSVGEVVFAGIPGELCFEGGDDASGVGFGAPVTAW